MALLPFKPTKKSKHSLSGAEAIDIARVLSDLLALMAKLFAFLSTKFVTLTTMTECKVMAFG